MGAVHPVARRCPDLGLRSRSGTARGRRPTPARGPRAMPTCAPGSSITSCWRWCSLRNACSVRSVRSGTGRRGTPRWTGSRDATLPGRAVELAIAASGRPAAARIAWGGPDGTLTIRWSSWERIGGSSCHGWSGSSRGADTFEFQFRPPRLDAPARTRGGCRRGRNDSAPPGRVRRALPRASGLPPVAPLRGGIGLRARSRRARSTSTRLAAGDIRGELGEGARPAERLGDPPADEVPAARDGTSTFSVEPRKNCL